MKEFLHLDTARMELAAFVSQTLLKLMLSAFLGGIIGLEREVRHKPAGLRTNMFICFGAAMFTILSFRYSMGTLDHNRISAQIIPGIGFIGAGAILRDRGSVTGLTTAATLFVVASIGMAVGGGEYLPAIFATLLIVLALNVLGWVERRFNLKPLVMSYEVLGKDPEQLIASTNRILDEEHQMMQTVQMRQVGEYCRVQFTMEARRNAHISVRDKLRINPEVHRVTVLGGMEEQ